MEINSKDFYNLILISSFEIKMKKIISQKLIASIIFIIAIGLLIVGIVLFINLEIFFAIICIVMSVVLALIGLDSDLYDFNPPVESED